MFFNFNLLNHKKFIKKIKIKEKLVERGDWPQSKIWLLYR